MFSRHLSVGIVSAALILSPVGASAVWAQTPSAPTAVSLQTSISTSARGAASQSGFQALPATEKSSALVAAISAGLSSTGASPDALADALIQAVASGVISGAVAVAVAQSVAPGLAAKVAAAPVVVASIRAGGATGATDTNGVSILSNLGPAAGGAGAAYDPCAGVTAAYCGG